MSNIRISEFNGVVPRAHPERLGRFNAQSASNCKLWNSKLRAFNQPMDVVSVAAGVKAFFDLQDNWLLFQDDVDLVGTILPGDKTGRLFYTGDGAPKLTDLSMALIGTTNVHDFTTDSTPQDVPYAYLDSVPHTTLEIDVGDTLNASVQIQSASNDVVDGCIELQFLAVDGVTVIETHLGSLVQGCAEFQVSLLQSVVVPIGTNHINLIATCTSGTDVMSRFCYFTKGAFTTADYPVTSVLLGVPAPTATPELTLQDIAVNISAAGNGMATIANGGSADIDSGGNSITVVGTFKVKGTSSKTDSGHITVSLKRDGTTAQTYEKAISVSGSTAEPRDVSFSGSFTLKDGPPTGSHNYTLELSWDVDLGTGDFTTTNVKGTIRQGGTVDVTLDTWVASDIVAAGKTIIVAGGYVQYCMTGGANSVGAGPSFAIHNGKTTTDAGGSPIWVCIGRLKVDDIAIIHGVKGMADLNSGTTIVGVSDNVVTVKCNTKQTYSSGGVFHKNIQASQDGSANSSDRAYLATYVANVDGQEMEGPPSDPSALIAVEPARCVLLDTFPATPSGYGIDKIRIYRTVTNSDGTAQFEFVTDITTTGGNTPGAYMDGALDKTLAGVLAQFSLIGPPVDMEGLHATANGVLGGFHANEVVLSEPYMPHAYPTEYRQTVDSEVMFTVPFGDSIAIGTKGNPYILTGRHPSDMSMQRIPLTMPCVSKKSAVDMGFAVLYATPQGIASISVNGAELITRGFFTQDEWAALDPASMRAAKHQDKYLFFYDTGAVQAGFIFDPQEPLDTMMPLDSDVLATWTNPETGDLYLNIADEIVQWDAGTDPLTYVWRSADWVMPRPLNMACAQVRATDYNDVTFKLYADGVLKLTYAVPDGETFWLPSGYMAQVYSVELTGTSQVLEVAAAETIEELRMGTSSAIEAQRASG